MNFTNEGGVCGTTRLLKNIAGLWLLQACRRCWAAAGHDYAYDELVTAAADDRHAFRSLFDPDYPDFLHPDDMSAAIAAYCRQTRSPSHRPAGLRARDPRKSRVQVPGRPRVARGPSPARVRGDPRRRRRRAQPPAQPVHRRCHRPARDRRTGRGDGARQYRHADAGDRQVSSLDEARAIIDRSFPVERFEPSNAERWDRTTRDSGSTWS